MTTTGLLDYIALVAILLVEPVMSWLWYWPRCMRAIRERIPGTRARLYGVTIATLWVFTLYILALWIAEGRPWSALRLDSAGPLRLGIGALLVAGTIAFFLQQARKVQKALARPKVVARLRETFSFADPFVPQTSGERRGFWMVSISAGICEEIVYRGFLMGLIAAWLGVVPAVILSSIIFGCVHVYLGVAQVPRVAIIGLVLALVVVASGSLWPAMIIHAAIDMSSGETGFRVGRAASAAPEAAPVTS